ncbi:MAG: FkbM family methyltransferase [Alphaproteobacteria bacterium]|nr:FkbM family methyltransferase [Alphaproteobacteria bacterium]
MDEEFFYQRPQQQSFLVRNRPVAIAVGISFILLVIVLFVEKSKSIMNLVPKLRGEVTLNDEFTITKIKNKFPLVIRADDPFFGTQLRFSGDINSGFSKVAETVCKSGDIVAEVGAYFGFNTIIIANKLRNNGQYYAYEANSRIYKCLKKSITLNELENVIILKNLAITSINGKCPIDDYASLSLTQTKASKTIKCPCKTIDEEFSGKRLTKLLVDLPEYGFDVLKGAYNLIENSLDLVIVFSFSYNEASKHFNVEEELKTLASKGLRFYVLDSNENYKQIHINNLQQAEDVVLIMAREELR